MADQKHDQPPVYQHQQSSPNQQQQQQPYPGPPQQQYSQQSYPQPQGQGQGQGPYPPQPYPPQQQGSYMQQQPMNAMNMGDAYRSNLYAQCAQGIHQPKTEYGVAGIIIAVLCFPCGLIALFMDVNRKCERCGVHM